MTAVGKLNTQSHRTAQEILLPLEGRWSRSRWFRGCPEEIGWVEESVIFSHSVWHQRDMGIWSTSGQGSIIPWP